MFLQMTRVLVITQSYTKIKGKGIITMNRNSTNYSNFYNEIVTSIRGAEIYENTEEQYIELPIITDENIAKAKEIIYGHDYFISKETEADGSDYPAYYIWFGELEYTEKGREKVKAYIKELEAKRKEILDAGKDTADDTYIPTLEDILDDASYWFVVEHGEYCNNWGVTDNYDADNAICLILGEDIEIK